MDGAAPAQGWVLGDVGCVAIGRNEGSRLERCLRSVAGRARHVVYVDSGSTDRSVELARSLGVSVVELDMSRPFTAARARNAGLERLRSEAPELRFVQFVDGDCEVVKDWLERACERLAKNPPVAVVCGRRRERHPEASLYNRLCDIEWDTPVGEALACGGDAMMRLDALSAVQGFDERVIAGEEPELCLRLRSAGWRVERLDAEMTLHDADMHRFSQWWRRAVRSGHAYAEGVAMHGRGPDQHWVKEARRIWFWGAAVPAAAVGGALPTLGGSLLLLGGYPVSAARAYRAARRRGRAADDALAHGVFCTLAKFPELQGMLRYHWNRRRGRRTAIIEYKR